MKRLYSGVLRLIETQTTFHFNVKLPVKPCFSVYRARLIGRVMGKAKTTPQIIGLPQ